MYIPDESGINSLGGFAYQIKVFVSYMLSMDEGMQAEFETVDDIAISKMTSDIIDDNEDKFRNLIVSANGIKAIQVKRTSITEKVAKQVLETISSRYDFICTQVNRNIQKLGSNIWYTGKNADAIRENIKEIKNMEETKRKDNDRNIVDLEVMYSNISEQIKIYENSISDAKQFENENSNRKKLLKELKDLVEEDSVFIYLVEPLEQLLNELDNTIAFSQYTIKDRTIAELKRQRSELKKEIKRNDSRFQCYTMEEKAKSIALIEEYLSANIRDCSEELKEIKKEIREIKEELRVLQNSDDIVKIRELSQFITMLYKSASGIS